MKRTFNLVAIILIAFSVQSFAGNKSIQTEKRTSSPYHYINIQGDLNVTLIQNTTPELSVSGSASQIKNTITLLRNDTLFITSSASYSGNKKVAIKINIDNLASLIVKGKTKVDCEGYINSDIFSIKADGGSEIKIDVRTLKVDSKATGCSHINLSGSTGDFTEVINSCSSIRSGELNYLSHSVKVVSVS